MVRGTSDSRCSVNEESRPRTLYERRCWVSASNHCGRRRGLLNMGKVEWGAAGRVLMTVLLTMMVGRVEAFEGSDDPIWVFITMPFISAVVGYATNVVALKMTFYPLEFWGLKIWQPEDQPLGFIGWQGIVPAKAAKMAGKSVDLMMDKLLNLKEIFSRLDPDEMSEELEPGLLAVVSKLMQEVGAKHMPGTWSFLPEDVRHEIVLKTLEDVPIFMRAFMEDVKLNVEEVLDVRHMVVTNMVKNKELMNRMFMEVGAKEISFIEKSGFFFGLLFGCFQTCLWFFYQRSWVLPVGGFLVGYVTNWLALKMIFRPVNERVVCGLRLHGLFLRRQDEVSASFAEINSKEILTSESMWEAILNGPKKDRFNEMCRKHTHDFVDVMTGGLRQLVAHVMGEKQFSAMKEDIARQMVQSLPIAIPFGHAYTNRALDMATTLREAMRGLSSQEFEGVLHPVFEEDELKLIIVGGTLGALVGVFQLFVLNR